jgi:hypothetical protein
VVQKEAMASSFGVLPAGPRNHRADGGPTNHALHPSFPPLLNNSVLNAQTNAIMPARQKTIIGIGGIVAPTHRLGTAGRSPFSSKADCTLHTRHH